jgi:hypothetical protein
MQGCDDPAILKRWLKLASQDLDPQRRSDIGSLALVFADLAGRGPLWQEYLKEWNVIESKIVKEWQAQGESRGRLETSRETLKFQLEERFGTLPEELVQRIQGTTDLPRLQAALRQVVHISTLDELQL